MQNLELHVENTEKEMLPVPCQYTFSLMNFNVNKEKFQTNPSVHSINTGKKHHLQRQIAAFNVSEKYILCWHHNIQKFSI
jgi:hypothetical protein